MWQVHAPPNVHLPRPAKVTPCVPGKGKRRGNWFVVTVSTHNSNCFARLRLMKLCSPSVRSMRRQISTCHHPSHSPQVTSPSRRARNLLEGYVPGKGKRRSDYFARLRFAWVKLLSGVDCFPGEDRNTYPPVQLSRIDDQTLEIQGCHNANPRAETRRFVPTARVGGCGGAPSSHKMC